MKRTKSKRPVNVFGSKEGKKVISLLNDLAAEETGGLDYKKAIIEEDKKFKEGGLKEVKGLADVGLEARKAKVREKLEKEYGKNLTKEGGTTKVKSQKGGVKQKQTTKKVVPPKVNMLLIGEKAEGFLRGLEPDLDGVKYELEKVYIGELNFKQNSRLIFGIRYRVCGNQVTYSLIAKETFKNFSKQLQGKYAPGNWNVLFDFSNGNDLSKFTPIIKASLEKLKKAKAELPKKAKVKK